MDLQTTDPKVLAAGSVVCEEGWAAHHLLYKHLVHGASQKDRERQALRGA